MNKTTTKIGTGVNETIIKSFEMTNLEAKDAFKFLQKAFDELSIKLEKANETTDTVGKAINHEWEMYQEKAKELLELMNPLN